jgi:hypothetical protein
VNLRKDHYRKTLKYAMTSLRRVVVIHTRGVLASWPSFSTPCVNLRFQCARASVDVCVCVWEMQGWRDNGGWVRGRCDQRRSCAQPPRSFDSFIPLHFYRAHAALLTHMIFTPMCAVAARYTHLRALFRARDAPHQPKTTTNGTNLLLLNQKQLLTTDL